ncbi:MAG: 1,4-alpha-glucan branching protein GlgB [Candidatus Omnitrophica bacterium]|nr:1,4-alpha-glucan branching protein GlgB [Candidatus Omnitrophota bacterium]
MATAKKRKSARQKKSIPKRPAAPLVGASRSSGGRPLGHLAPIRPIGADRVHRIVHFLEDRPFEILGPHFLKTEKHLSINAFLPRAQEAWLIPTDAEANLKKIPMRRIHPNGFFQAIFKGSRVFRYTLGFKDGSGYVSEAEDPYTFKTEITDYDLYLISEGNHFKSYEKFGAHLKTFNEISGVHFAVWAPNAKSVSVVGNFNHWYAGAHPMTRIGDSGVWGLFIPGLQEGEVYKYAIKSHADGEVRIKADPYAFRAELRPRTASVVAKLDRYEWHDSDWLAKRAKHNSLDAPISVYEVHLGSWKRTGPDGAGFLSYRELAHDLVNYVQSMGYTHIELLPVMEHPFDQSWGYQVLGYYAPTSRFGTPEDFMYFIDVCHQHDIGVILDWVPSHFPKDGHGLAYFDGKQIYAYEGWKKGEHKDWQTFIFDYGRNEVRNFLISNALFWLEKYHVDGLRVDAVASMLYLDYSRKEGEWDPNLHGGRENLEAISFLKKFNEVVHLNHPGVLTIAEESTAWGGVSRPTYLGGLGFSMKWNMGWMHDTLEYVSKDSVHRKYHQDMLTFSMLYAFTENFVLPLSHDEVVHGKRSLFGKMPGDEWQRFANLRLFLGFMFAHPGKKLLFMGGDFAQSREWDSGTSLDWHFLDYAPHRQVHQFVKDLNAVYKKYKAFYEVDFEYQGFEWIDFSDAGASLISFIRWSRDYEDLLLVTCNMTPVPRMSYRLGVPRPGFYEEIFNSDAREYGGSGIGNLGGVRTQDISWQSRPCSIQVHFPPLAINIYRWKASAP